MNLQREAFENILQICGIYAIMTARVHFVIFCANTFEIFARILYEKGVFGMTLIVMAAGLGSRFGNGIKQLAPVGPAGELIMDYSVYDAKKAGFDKVVFVVRKEIFQEFRESIGERLEKIMNVSYVFQELTALPEGFSLPQGRTKPWGTCHAVLCCKEVVQEPFVIINADDYYGKEVYAELAGFLRDPGLQDGICHLAMAGYTLSNTLSPTGGVTRGICLVNEEKMLDKIVECRGIVQNKNKELECVTVEAMPYLSMDSKVSMNIWAGFPAFFDLLEEGFKRFLSDWQGDMLTKEFLIPVYIDELIGKKKVAVKMIDTSCEWIGITYKEDTAAAREQFARKIESGEYSRELWRSI